MLISRREKGAGSSTRLQADGSSGCVDLEEPSPRVELSAAIANLGPWFHNLHLPDGSQTAPNHYLGDFPTTKWRKIGPLIPQDLAGWEALDVGCNAGFYSFELARRGARVTAIDLNRHYLAQAQWAAKQYGLEDRIEFRQMQVYDLAGAPETFDLVWFMGVFYHLRYPMLGLDIVAQKVRRLMVFQTLTMPGKDVYPNTYQLDIENRGAMNEPGWPKLAFIEHQLAGDPTNWWAPNHAGVEAMLRSSGMKIKACPGHEIYLCEPDPDHPSCVSTWNTAEILSATGRTVEMRSGVESDAQAGPGADGPVEDGPGPGSKSSDHPGSKYD